MKNKKGFEKSGVLEGMSKRLSKLIDLIDTSEFTDEGGHQLTESKEYVDLIEYIGNFIEGGEG